MKASKIILAALILFGVAAALAPSDAEACGFFRRLFGGRGEPQTVPPPEISPGVPVYPESSAYYRYSTAYAPTTVYYRRPVTTYYYPSTPVTTYYYRRTPVTTYYYSGVPVTSYYRRPVTAYYYGAPTTAYYAGPGCASSVESTPAPTPEPQGEPQGPSRTYAPEDPQAGQQQQLRKPTPAEEQSGFDAPSPVPPAEAPSSENGSDVQSQQPPVPPLPDQNEGEEAAAPQVGRSAGVELIAPQYTITALPPTPRTVEARDAESPDVWPQTTPAAAGPSPRWVPVARPTSVAKR